MSLKTTTETTQNETQREKKNISKWQNDFMCDLMYIKLESLKEKGKVENIFK